MAKGRNRAFIRAIFRTLFNTDRNQVVRDASAAAARGIPATRVPRPSAQQSTRPAEAAQPAIAARDSELPPPPVSTRPAEAAYPAPATRDTELPPPPPKRPEIQPTPIIAGNTTTTPAGTAVNPAPDGSQEIRAGSFDSGSSSGSHVSRPATFVTPQHGKTRITLFDQNDRTHDDFSKLFQEHKFHLSQSADDLINIYKDRIKYIFEQETGQRYQFKDIEKLLPGAAEALEAQLEEDVLEEETATQIQSYLADINAYHNLKEGYENLAESNNYLQLKLSADMINEQAKDTYFEFIEQWSVHYDELETDFDRLFGDNPFADETSTEKLLREISPISKEPIAGTAGGKGTPDQGGPSGRRIGVK